MTNYHQGALPDSQVKDRFYRFFQQECTELQDQIARLDNYSLAGGEKQDAIDHVLSGISRLANDVTDSSAFVPAYDQRIYAQASIYSSESILSSLTYPGHQSSRREAARNTSQVCPKVKISVQEQKYICNFYSRCRRNCCRKTTSRLKT